MTGLTRSRATRLTLAVVGLFVLYVVGVIVRRQFGVRVIVSNESGEALRQVSVKVESIGDGARGPICTTLHRVVGRAYMRSR